MDAMKRFPYLVIVLLGLCSVVVSSGDSIFDKVTDDNTPITIVNPSFESNKNGWTTSVNGWKQNVLNDELAAAPDGSSYLRIVGKGTVQQTLTGTTIQAGRTYVAKVWARSVNPPSVAKSLTTKARLEWKAVGGGAKSTKSVQAPTISAVKPNGSNTNTIGDDGVNVWFDNGYRMHAAGWFYYQKLNQNPVTDPWTKGKQCGDGMANGPVIGNGGPKALYDTFYTEDQQVTVSRIDRMTISGKAPNYQLADATSDDEAGEIYETVLKHRGDQSPWVIDAHLTHDTETGKLWMAWGGHALWVTEMDPVTGNVKGNPSNPEFDTHDSGLHKCVAAWEPRDFRTCTGADKAPSGWDGDENGVAYHEGPALYKKNNQWYYCASYGSMGFSYTLRCCKSSDPYGPFVDKDGIGCTKFDTNKNRFGASMLLGPEGHQAVPGHPHMWMEADGTEYLGYDFRNYQNGKGEDDPFTSNDEMGIRKLYWVDGWPTIWTPLTVKYVANEHPETIGQTLTIKLGNYGHKNSQAAFDFVEAYSYEDDSPPPPDRCYNLKTFRLGNNKKQTCAWIAKKSKRRKNKCKMDLVKVACPSVCGLDCCDDPTFTFTINTGGKKSCDWLSDKTARVDVYCKKQLVKTQCSETCNYCFD